MAFWAAQILGAIVVPLNAWWTSQECSFALRDSTPTVLIVDEERFKVIAPRLGGSGIERVIGARFSGALPNGVVSWHDELGYAGSATSSGKTDISPDDVATILYTSGTTGAPKGVVLTQRNHATNLRNTELVAAVAALTTKKAVTSGSQGSLQTFPFFHVGGLSGLYASAAAGRKLVLMYRWDTVEATALIDTERITHISAVPTLLRRLVEHVEPQKRGLSSVVAIASGGAPVPPDLVHQIQEKFGRRISLSNGYGLTETTGAIAFNGGAEYWENPDSVGRAFPGTDLKFVDPATGKELQSGSRGEIWVRGPSVASGYWTNEADTEASFSSGWFRTGDLGYQGTNGMLYVVDRLKDVVIRGGENVYCAEVEAVLQTHPAVGEVAVIGVPHPNYGEEVAAVVEVRAGTSLSEDELKEFATSQLSSFKVPSRVYFVEDGLPRTATGKVLKRILRENYGNTSAGRTAAVRAMGRR